MIRTARLKTSLKIKTSLVQAIQSLIGEANFLEKINDLNGCRKCYLKADRLLPIAKNFALKAVLAALKAQIEKGLSKSGTKL
jgi:hypothetical protein